MEEVELLELRPQAEIDSQATKDYDDISRHASNQLCYSEFYWRYMKSNWPVLLTEVSNKWECHRNWTTNIDSTNEVFGSNNNSSQRVINFDYLKSKIDNCCVPVADCSKEYYNSHAKIDLEFHNFLNYWQEKQKKNSYKIDNSINKNSVCETSRAADEQNLYLKDWHLKMLMPDYDFYHVPKHFASDWLNEKLILDGQDDYRFVYMGPKDSWTPFHADVFGSYSWSTNITGCKKWIMLPPGEEQKLRDKRGNLPFFIEESKLQAHEIRFFTIMQKENEALFVPSGWYHQVWNCTDTISVNHNWFNACNVKFIWGNLQKNMQQVITEIDDCRQMDNFDEHCQTMLRASFGINYLDFLDILEFITMRRLHNVECDALNAAFSVEAKSSKNLLFDRYLLNDLHSRHDLHAIQEVTKLMLEDVVVCNNRVVLYRRCLRLQELTR